MVTMMLVFCSFVLCGVDYFVVVCGYFLVCVLERCAVVVLVFILF